jgi:CheY-like chemotaxis protein
MPKLLLVEDNELNREMLSRRLVRKGFEVVIAVDGLQGVALAASEQPDLVLMDMSLPGIDGWEATRRLKADAVTRAMPVIALTAQAMSDDRAKALAAGCDEFDTKPVDLARLLGKINALLQAPAASGAAPLAMDMTLPAALHSLAALQAALEAFCAKAGVAREVRDDLQVVLDEVCANIFEHAYPPEKPGTVRVQLRQTGADAAQRASGLELVVTDQGAPFNPLTVPEPDVTLAIEDRPAGGLGIHLVRQLTHSQRYRHSPTEGNCLTLFRRLP